MGVYMGWGNFKNLKNKTMVKVNYSNDNYLSFCRYIKDGVCIGEFEIPNGSYHKDRVAVAIKNNIDFDCYFIFYVEENNGIKHYDSFSDEKGALGMYKNSNKVFLFDSITNKEIKMIGRIDNIEFF